MNQLTQRQMQQHVLILGWLHIALNLLTLLVAGFLFVFLAGIGPVVGDAEATRILGLVAVVVSIFLVMLALPGILAGIGLLKGKRWGRILTIIVGILSLINFPIGTAVGVYTLWVLLKDEVVDFLAAQPQEAKPSIQALSSAAG